MKSGILWRIFIVILIISSACKQPDRGGKETGASMERVKFTSPETGRDVWQITTDSAGSVACYFEMQAFTHDDRFIVFSSRRGGSWRLYRSDLLSGEVMALSPPEHEIPFDDYTIHPDGEHVCYVSGHKLYMTNVATTDYEELIDFGDYLSGRVVFSGSFSDNGRYTLALSIEENVYKIFRADLQTGDLLLIHEQDTGRISHAQLNPVYPQLVTYVPGPDTQNDMSLPMEQRARTWLIDIEKGSDKQFLTMPYGYRATHESWSKDGERFFFFRKTRPGWEPVTICSINKEGDDFREYYSSDSIRLGHGTASPDGKWFISDSQDPGRNPLVFVNLDSGEATILCWPDASTDGGHSKFAHVHPFFSTSGKYVCYTSDASGVPQVFIVPVSDIIAQ